MAIPVVLQFVDVNFELGTQYNKVIAPQDVALYGALCALASFDRADLKVRCCLKLFMLSRVGGSRLPASTSRRLISIRFCIKMSMGCHLELASTIPSFLSAPILREQAQHLKSSFFVCRAK